MIRSVFLGMLPPLALVSPAPLATHEPDPLTRIDEFIGSTVAAAATPGFAVAIVRGGKIVYAKGFGSSDVESKQPVTADTVFAIGSVSKQFTAAAVLLLAHDRKLRLDDRVAAYEPKIPNASQLTLRELLHQTSGLHDYPNSMEHAWPTAGRIPTQRIVDVLTTDKPDFEPGTQWAYSNANYAVLTAIVERVSGESMAAFLASRIFKPAGMTRSGFGYDAARKLGPATAYQGTRTFTRQDTISADLFSGAGAVYASVSDLARWDVALLENRVLDAASRALMFAPGTLNDGTRTSYGMGVVPDMLAGHRLVWHNGLAPGAGGYCYNGILPDDRMAVAVLSNGYDFTGGPERLVRRIASLYFNER